ncbi:MAG: lipoyl(octanoyl) transferase [Planctomycetota bacterium]|nr:MAG: lipoyl(octanoyl) transferase [Planctomycetota bacterium]
MAISTAPRWEVEDLGRCAYQEAGVRMAAAVAERAAGGDADRLLLAEFEPVLTVGRGGGPAAAYAGLGIPVYEVERGGKATFHGPGQVVAYPIVGLEGPARDLHAYLHALEEALIRTVGRFGLVGGRDPRNTGCWVRGRKIASIGVAVRRWVAYHGVALNVSTDLAWFRRFDPCGLAPDTMTSLAEELRPDPPPSLRAVKAALAEELAAVLRT